MGNFMRQSQSAVLERGHLLEQVHETEPFEVAWATEARFWIHFLQGSPNSRVRFQRQISPDGINWIDHESSPVEVTTEGFVTIPVEQFGFWLRLRTVRVSGDDELRLRIYLQLKE